jgi:hypothetical protein
VHQGLGIDDEILKNSKVLKMNAISREIMEDITRHWHQDGGTGSI